MKKILLTAFIFSAIVLTCNMTNAFANPLPTSVDVLDRERIEQPAPLSQPKIVMEEEVPQDFSQDTSQAFVLKEIVIDGNTFFTDSEMTAPYTKLYGTTITFNQLLAIVDEMTKLYRDAGHILSRVVLPPQEADEQGATVRFQAIEGFVSSVQYQGDEKLVEKFKKYFKRIENQILFVHPLNHKKFESLMLRVQGTPGLEIATSFEPANETTGASTLVIELGRKIISGNIGFNNTGSESSGPIMLNAGLSASSFPLLGLNANVSYGQALDFDEYHYWQAGLSYNFANGFTMLGNYGQSYSPNPDTAFARQFEYETSSKYFSFGASYPIIRSRDMNLNASATFNYRDSESRIQSSKNTEDKTRNLTLSLNYDMSDIWGGTNQVIFNYVRGLDMAGASDYSAISARPNAGANFNKLNIFLSRNQTLPKSFSLYLSASGQTTDEQLFSYEQFSLGGSQFGRGYDSGVVSGDQGLAAAAELRWTYFYKEKYGIQPYAFVDWGTTRFLPSTDVDTPWLSVSSTGVGVNVWGSIMDVTNFNASFFVAKPLERVLDVTTDDWRAIFTFSLSF